MPINLHAPTRRELFLASGALFAWAYMPKVALAEGRDPRFLTIVLRGALDGLAAVVPVGDPDWVSLRGDKALVLGGSTPALPLDSFFSRSIRRCRTCTDSTGRTSDHHLMQPRPRIAQRSAFRRPGRARRAAKATRVH
jgi:hypothetical protein